MTFVIQRIHWLRHDDKVFLCFLSSRLEWVLFLQWSQWNWGSCQFLSWCDIEHTAVTIAPNLIMKFFLRFLRLAIWTIFMFHKWDWSHVMLCPDVTFVIQPIYWLWNADKVFSYDSWSCVWNEFHFCSDHNETGFHVNFHLDVKLNIQWSP